MRKEKKSLPRGFPWLCLPSIFSPFLLPFFLLLYLFFVLPFVCLFNSDDYNLGLLLLEHLVILL